MNDNEIEKEIQEKGLTAPRVTLAHVEAVISEEYYTTAANALKGTPGCAAERAQQNLDVGGLLAEGEAAPRG